MTRARPSRLALTAAVGACALFAAPQLQAQVTVEIGARDPSISPDGNTIALSILGKIWTLPASGGVAQQVTSGTSWDIRPAWSPDGRFLAYAARTGAGADLIVRNMATGGSRYVHHAPSSIGQITFSPTGDDLYFVNDTNQYDAHIWRLPLGGGEPEQLTFTQNWHEWSYALSPDGDRMLLESGRYEGTDVFEMDLEDRSIKRHTETPGRVMGLATSRDGLAHAWVGTFDGVDEIVVTTDGRSETVHTSDYDQKQLAFFPDGSLLVVGGRRLYRLDPSGGDLTPIPFRATFDAPSAAQDDWAITNVRLFDATSDTEIPSATVVVRDGRIVSVDANGGAPPAGVELIDGEGRLLMPGLMDNHLHFWAPRAGSDLIARGVTTTRDPGSAISDIMDYKDAIRLGLLAGPDIFAAGPLIDGFGGYHPAVDVNIEDPSKAAALVRSLKAQGVDLLKAYFQLDHDVFRAVMAEAKVQGLPVTGHIGVRVSWNEAIDAGINGFNHIRVWHDFMPDELQQDGRAESLDSGRNYVGRMQANWDLIDPGSPEVTALLTRMAETETAMDPTLFVQGIGDGDRRRLSLEQHAGARESFERMGAFVRRAVELGVPLLAGTDNVSLFDELEAYEEAGVPNAAILHAATVNGARWLGKEEEFGTVTAGSRAHLILVDGDPLTDMKQLREIDLVMKDGVIVFER